MKIEELARPGLFVFALAASAALGFAAGVALTRDPEVLRRTVRGVAAGLERATLLAAQAREHVADLWAEAREEALAEVDAADFERAAAGSSTAAASGRRKGAAKPAGRARKPRSASATKTSRAAADAASKG